MALRGLVVAAGQVEIYYRRMLRGSIAPSAASQMFPCESTDSTLRAHTHLHPESKTDIIQEDLIHPPERDPTEQQQHPAVLDKRQGVPLAGAGEIGALGDLFLAPLEVFH